jgi:peptidoglycan-N-acetylglucosamine deacetylase
MKKLLIIIACVAVLLLVNATILYVVITNYEEQYREQNQEAEIPAPDPAAHVSLSGKILWHGNRDLPEVALTFDDGPSSRYTPKYLDILKKYKVPATFFLIGRFVEKNPDLVSREAAEGYTIGNHTYSHADGKITDMNKIKWEISKTTSLIENITHKKERFFRPPFGYENWRFLGEAELMDYKVILWTLDVADWDPTRTSSFMVNKILSTTTNGTIILLHDGGLSREADIVALPQIIKGLRKKGFKFVTVEEMVRHLK